MNDRDILTICRVLDQTIGDIQATADDRIWDSLHAWFADDPTVCDGFMWMGYVTIDLGGFLGTCRIDMYKHGITRRYLNLSNAKADGGLQAWKYLNGPHYRRISRLEAEDHVFADLHLFGADKHTAYSLEYRTERNRRLVELGYTVLSS